MDRADVLQSQKGNRTYRIEGGDLSARTGIVASDAEIGSFAT